MSHIAVRNREVDAEQWGPFFAKSSPWGIVGWAIFTVFLCLHFCLTYLSNPPFLNMERYLQGQEITPYQYRVLPMYVYRFFIHSHTVAAIARRVPAPLNNPYAIILFGIAFLSVIGAVLATAATISRLTGDHVLARWMSLLVVYMSYFNLAPHWGLNYTLPYDTPSLFFFCLGLYLIVDRRWWLYYILFPIAVLNRETICFLSVFFLVWEWFRNSSEPTGTDESIRGRMLRLIPHALAQGAIWVGIKLILAHRFMANPAEGNAAGGSVFSGHLVYNLHELVKPQQWPVFLSICGFLLPVLWVGRRSIQSKGMSWGCGIVMGLWLIGMMKVGVMVEIRVFSEWTAFVVPALALITYHRFLKPANYAAMSPDRRFQ